MRLIFNRLRRSRRDSISSSLVDTLKELPTPSSGHEVHATWELSLEPGQDRIVVPPFVGNPTIISTRGRQEKVQFVAHENGVITLY
jgi:hypothetical protein